MAEKSGKKAPSSASKANAKKPAAKKKVSGSAKVSPSVAKTVPYTIETMEIFMNKGTNKQYEKIAQDAAAAGQEQVEALVQCGSILAKGMEDIFKACISLGQGAAEKNQKAAQALLSCKTVDEFAQAQSKYAQANFDEIMAGATKLSEMSVKVCTDSFEPLNDQISKTIRKASEAVAA